MRLFARTIYNRKLLTIRCYSSEDEGGYLTRRLQDLKEQSTLDKNDPLVKLSEYSENDGDTEWATEGEKIDADMVLEIVNLQKRSSNMDGSERKLQFPSKNTDSEAQKEAFQFIQNIPGLNFQDKLERAQNRALKYKLRHQKIQEAKDRKEQLQFKELYAERFTPIGSFEKLESLADKRIEESMKQGGFKDVQKVRGKPNELPKPNQHVSTTEHYLNQILVKQKIVPPWIESQGNVNRDIADFRAQLHSEFQRELVSTLKKFKILNSRTDVKKVRECISGDYGSVSAFLQYRFQKWKNSRTTWADSKVNAINSGLRTYNLQAPLSTQKLYLLVDKEFQRVHDNVDFDATVDNEIITLKNQKTKSQPKTSNLTGFFKFW